MRTVAIILFVLWGLVGARGDEYIPMDTKTGKVKVTSSSTGTVGKPIDFGSVTVVGITGGGGGGGGVTSILATSPIVVTPSPIINTGTISLLPASKANWDAAYSERQQWDGDSGAWFDPALGRTSLGLGTAATANASAFEVALTFADSIVRTTPTTVRLSGDVTTPGNSKYYGTSVSGTKGWFDLSAVGGVPGGIAGDFQFNSAGTLGGVGTARFVSGEMLFTSTSMFVTGDSDPTKRMKFSVVNVPTATTATVVIPSTAAGVPVVVAATPAPTNQVLKEISALGVSTFVQPTFAMLGGAISTAQNNVPVGRTIYVDQIYGNNTSALPARFDKPYLTIAAALAAASPGDVVYVGSGTFALAGTALAIPAGVQVTGAGADYTIITSTVAKATNHASVEGGTGGGVSNLTIQNTGISGVPFGALSSSPGFTSFNLSSVKLIGVSDGINLGKAGTTGLRGDNLIIQTQAEGIVSSQASTTHDFAGCQITLNGAATNNGIDVTAGTVTYRDGTINVSGGTTNTAVKAIGANATVELHGVVITRSGTGFGLQQGTSAVLKADNVSRNDGTALATSGTITETSRYAVIDNNGSDFPNPALVQANLSLVPGSDIQEYSTNLDSLAALPVTLANAGKSVVVNVGGTGFDLTTITGGGGGTSATKQDVGDSNATVTGGVTVVNLTTALTASRVITLPAASTYSPLQPLVIEDPRAVESGAFTISLARAGSDTINGGTSNVTVLGAAEAGGAVQIMSDGVSKWTTISKGGGSRFAKGDGNAAHYLDGTGLYSTPATGGTGTVTSVGLVGTANQITITGTSPITTSGSFTASIPSSAQLSVAKLTNLTTNGFVKTGSSDGTLSVDTSTYLTSSTGVVGPGSATDNAITRFDATTGKLIQNSLTTLDDSGNGLVAPGWSINSNQGSVLEVDFQNKSAGASTDVFRFYSSTGSILASIGAGGGIEAYNAPYSPARGFFNDSSGLVSWNGDTVLARNAAGVVEINNGTPSSYRDLICRDVTARIKPRVTTSSTGNTTPTPSADTDDMYIATGMTVNMVFGAPTGTPVEGQKLIIRIKDSGSTRTLGFNAIYHPIGVTLPTATTASKKILIGCIYNAVDSGWDVVAVSTET